MLVAVSTGSCRKGGLHGTPNQDRRYHEIYDRFTALFSEAGISYVDVESPESFKHKIYFQWKFGPAVDQIVHIAFSQPAELRPLFGCYNICYHVCDSEGQLEHKKSSGVVLENKIHMLSLFDEIWTSSQYSLNILARYGLRKAIYIPTPLNINLNIEKTNDIVHSESRQSFNDLCNLPITQLKHSSRLINEETLKLDRMSAVPMSQYLDGIQDNRPIIFLHEVASSGAAEVLLNVIEGFVLGTQHRADAILLVNMTEILSANERNGALARTINRLLGGPGAYAEPRVLFLVDELNPLQANAVRKVAQFHIVAPYQAGINLPLQDAMANGGIVLAPRRYAMADAVDESVGILVEDYPSPLMAHQDDAWAGLEDDPIPVSTRFDVAVAVDRAMRLTAAERAGLAMAARHRAANLFGSKVVMASINARMAVIRRGAKAAASRGLS